MILDCIRLFAFEHQDLATSTFGFEPEVLLPLLRGLFGASVLVISLATSAEVPPQRDSEFEISGKEAAKSALLGGFAGSIVAWVPGVTPAVATVVARLGTQGSEEEFLVSISGVNTANALFALVALQVVGRPRSGAAAAIDELVEIDQSLLLAMVATVLATALLSYFATIQAGKLAARVVRRVNYRLLCGSVLVFLAGMTLAFTGVFGLFLFFLATTVGLIAPLFGIRKTHAMGVLMLPLLIRYLLI